MSYLVFGASKELGTVEISRTHPLESLTEVPEPLTLFCPLWDWKRTMPAFQVKSDGATSNRHMSIIGKSIGK